MSTLKEGDVEVTEWDHEDGAGEIGAEREVEGAGVVVELGEARSEGATGDVVQDEAVNVDDGGGVAELDAGHEEEDKRDHRAHRVQHLSLTSFDGGHVATRATADDDDVVFR